MREIIFRGKRVDTGEWIEGLLWKKKYNHNKIFISYFPDEDDHEDAVVVTPETVGQYTGLKDKNGVKIFEGDIVDASDGWWYASGPAGHDSPIIKVEYNESVCGFAPFAIYDCDCGVYIYPDECTVIGNIHDNPELIGGDNND